MNDVESYQSSNHVQKRDAIYFLDEYSSKIKWKKGKIRVLDIGSGDGGVTKILQKYIPTDYTLLGCDVNVNMVDYANSHHGNEQESFIVLDIEGDLPEGLKGSFDHVFSFYALHWVINQERAFTNIFELLSNEGSCFMIFGAYAPVIDVYRILLCSYKWKPWIQNLGRYTKLPYSDIEEPEKVMREMMVKIGFTDIEVERRKQTYIFENMEVARTLKSVCPFDIPKELYNDFMDDYMEAVKEVEMFNIINKGPTETLKSTMPCSW